MSRDDLTRRYPVLSTHWPGFPPENESPPHIADIRLQHAAEDSERELLKGWAASIGDQGARP